MVDNMTSERENQRVLAALVAFSHAASAVDYISAKRLAAKCSHLSQFSMVDTINAARKRLVGQGVAL